MKATFTILAPLIATLAHLVGAGPVEKRVVCPLYLPAVSDDPFEATALTGYYLDSAGKVAVLVKGDPLTAFTYSSNGPLGLWGPAQTNVTCPGYFYLNVNTKTSVYASLTFDAVATTKWNATAGSDLTQIGSTSSSFIACKRPATSTKAGDYVLFLLTGTPIPTTLSSDDGDSIVGTTCVKTKIHVNN